MGEATDVATEADIFCLGLEGLGRAWNSLEHLRAQGIDLRNGQSST